jgi:hypothetical protein
MLQTVSAAIVLAICLVMMARLLIGPNRRAALDRWARLFAWRVKQAWLRLVHFRRSRKTAEQLAEEAIRRARDEGHWEGNVYKPKSFSKRPPRDKLH